MKKVNIHEKSVKCHEKSKYPKNLFVSKISKNIFSPDRQGQGQGQEEEEEELSLQVLL